MEELKIEWLRVGQQSAYQDSHYDAKITGPVETPDDVVLAQMLIVHPALPASEKKGENWSSDFYVFRRVKPGEWRYEVTREFTG